MNKEFCSPPLTDDQGFLDESQNETKALLERIRQGDEQAFDAIYKRWSQPIINFLKVFTRAEHDAEDLSQDVFATLWRKRELNDTTKSGKSFLFTVARHTAADVYRKKSAAKNYIASASFESEEDISSHEILEAKEIELLTEYAISTMPPQRREVYLLIYKDGLKPAEIAERLNIPAQNVHSHLRQARIYIK